MLCIPDFIVPVSVAVAESFTLLDILHFPFISFSLSPGFSTYLTVKLGADASVMIPSLETVVVLFASSVTFAYITHCLSADNVGLLVLLYTVQPSVGTALSFPASESVLSTITYSISPILYLSVADIVIVLVSLKNKPNVIVLTNSFHEFCVESNAIVNSGAVSSLYLIGISVESRLSDIVNDISFVPLKEFSPSLPNIPIF